MKHQVGIDSIGFYTSHYCLDLKTLARARNVEPDKYQIGLGQQCMSVSPPGEDIVTLAANAAREALAHTDPNSIDTILFATESGIDQSKAAGIFVHQLLKLPNQCRIVELKQACYSATAGLQMGMAMLKASPNKKILLIASDIARYGLNTSGESSQGGGAIAMVLASEPRILAIEPESGFYTEDAMDFWRPNYREEALVEGKYSVDLYLKLLKETWHQYTERSGRSFKDVDYFCYHIPVPKLAEKAHHKLCVVNNLGKPSPQQVREQMGESLRYGRITGNCYTASLYLGLLSLLEQTPADLSGKRIGLYSYGSGCVAEFFSGTVQAHYKDVLNAKLHESLLNQRIQLNQADYEAFYTFVYPSDGSRLLLPKYQTGSYRLAEINQHKRIYEVVTP